MTQSSTPLKALARWTTWVPLAALVLLAATWTATSPPLVVLLAGGVVLAAAVMAAVHHAEVIAHRVGEPFGSLVLALAVTAIEVGLILVLMIEGTSGAETLARDTVFAAAMITTNGIVGITLLAGSARGQRLAYFNAEGSGAALAAVITVTVLALVLPSVTQSAPGAEYSSSQLVFAAVMSLVLWLTFVITQTVRHRDFFLPVDKEGGVLEQVEHAEPPSVRETWLSAALLITALVGVVGLAKVESKPIAKLFDAAGLPAAFIGVVIAVLVLAPESIAAARNAARGRPQIGLNLAYGSAMASIGLTIPVLAVAMIFLDQRLVLGLGNVHLVLLVLTSVVSVLTLVPGRATRLQGGIHLTIFCAFIFLSAVP